MKNKIEVTNENISNAIKSLKSKKVGRYCDIDVYTTVGKLEITILEVENGYVIKDWNKTYIAKTKKEIIKAVTEILK